MVLTYTIILAENNNDDSSDCPNEVRYFPEADDIAAKLTEDNIQDIIEIFKTPLEGSYNWDYSSIDGRIRKLYRLGKELNGIRKPTSIGIKTILKINPLVICHLIRLQVCAFETMSDEQKLSFGWFLDDC